MYGTLDISTSGMIAQRTRLEAIAANIANKDTILDEAGRNSPFQRRVVYFAPGDPAARSEGGQRLGVHVSAIGSEPGYQERFDPDNPYADERGLVKYPDVNVVWEQLNAYEAQRAYEANVAAAEGSKAMLAQALRLLA